MVISDNQHQKMPRSYKPFSYSSDLHKVFHIKENKKHTYLRDTLTPILYAKLELHIVRSYLQLAFEYKLT